nr:hypothetical protein RSP597_10850 [Ralstonia solanacearum]
MLLGESVRTTSTRLTNVWPQMTLEHWQYSSRVMRDTGRLVRIVATLPQWGQLIFIVSRGVGQLPAMRRQRPKNLFTIS